VGETVITPTGAKEGTGIQTYCYNAAGVVTAYSGPEAEPESSEGTEEQEYPTYGTCYSGGEGPPNICGLEDPPSEYKEVAEDPVEQKYMGIADDAVISEFNIFKVKLFTELGVDVVRHTTPWNLVWEAEHGERGNRNAGKELAELREWLTDAKKLDNGTGEAYISFRYCSSGSAKGEWINPLSEKKEPCSKAPQWQEYEAGVKAFFAPEIVKEGSKEVNVNAPLNEVQNYTAWNEPNHTEGEGKAQKLVSGEPNGRLAGQYWAVLDGICDTKKPTKCKVAAGDFYDGSMQLATNKKSFGGNYLAEYWKGMGEPAHAERWAWHPYLDGEKAGKHFSQPKSWWPAFKEFRKAIDSFHKKPQTPEIWITEAGAVFESNHERHISNTQAQDVVRAYMDYKNYQLTSQAQVTRFFYYNMRGGAGVFDSGLLELYSTQEHAYPRELYKIYKSHTPR
jgi:hypothetical protein